MNLLLICMAFVASITVAPDCYAQPIANREKYVDSLDAIAKSFRPVYERTREGDALKITYRIPYLDDLERRGYIRGADPSYDRSHTVLRFDFKLNNPTQMVKYASSVIFLVKSSSTVLFDIPYFEDSTWQSVSGGNVGWAALENLAASYTVAPEQECHQSPRIRPELKNITPDHRMDPEHESFSWNITYSDIPKSLGLTLQQFRGNAPAPDLYGCVTGLLKYHIQGRPVQRLYATTVKLSGGRVSPYADVTATYNLFLEAGRSNYVHELPISNFIRPNEPDRFAVNFSSNMSATFDFDVSVKFTDGSTLDLGHVQLNYFRPKVKVH